MIFKPTELVEYISSVMKLEKGDLVFTGTPSGVGKVERENKIEAKLGDIAELVCTVV
jgi:2-keto-4-pentenoate hydratase/2-oxohepta-3-ene-1,7-dioic acid hydratase in catechol pathway